MEPADNLKVSRDINQEYHEIRKNNLQFDSDNEILYNPDEYIRYIYGN